MGKTQKNSDALANFCRESLGVPADAFGKAFRLESDWALVIKYHAYVEGALNVLIVRHFGDQRLEEVVSNLDISDRRKGKLAFVKALDLLPKPHRSFVQKFSELRNEVAHDVKNVNFDMKKYMSDLEPKRFKEISEAMLPVMMEFWQGFPEDQVLYNIKNQPRFALLCCVAAIMLRDYEKQQVGDYLSLGSQPFPL
jgi:hypothetical protein